MKIPVFYKIPEAAALRLGLSVTDRLELRKKKNTPDNVHLFLCEKLHNSSIHSATLARILELYIHPIHRNLNHMS